jgi:Protein of unknown function (DUF4019)
MSIAARFFSLAGLVVAILFGLQGCGVSADKAKAEAAVEVFHQQLDAGDFDAIWNSTDVALRAVTSEAKFDKFVGAVHGKLGHVVKTSSAGWRVQSFNLKTNVVLQQKTNFEHGSGTETFTFAVHGEALKLAGYYVESEDLVTL